MFLLVCHYQRPFVIKIFLQYLRRIHIKPHKLHTRLWIGNIELEIGQSIAEDKIPQSQAGTDRVPIYHRNVTFIHWWYCIIHRITTSNFKRLWCVLTPRNLSDQFNLITKSKYSSKLSEYYGMWKMLWCFTGLWINTDNIVSDFIGTCTINSKISSKVLIWFLYKKSIWKILVFKYIRPLQWCSQLHLEQAV